MQDWGFQRQSIQIVEEISQVHLSNISFVNLSKLLFLLFQGKILEIWWSIFQLLFSIHPGLPESGRSKLSDGGTCTYVCKQNKFCNVNFNANGPFSGRTKGLCFDYENRHDCEGTPIFCEDCDSKCRGRVGATFSELVGPEQ